MSEYCSLHFNIPCDVRERMERIVDSGKYLNLSDAARHYIRKGVKEDEERK